MDSRDEAPKGTKYMTFETVEDVGRNPTDNPTMGDIINERLARRDVMRGMLAVSAMGALLGSTGVLTARRAEAAAGKASFSFPEVEHGVDERHHVAQGYDADVLIRWGDPVLPGAPKFDPMNQSAEAQAKQFGYNNDYVGYIPLPLGSNTPDHGLLVVNHEYTDEEVMFPGVGKEQQKAKFDKITKTHVEIEIAAHGGSVIEIRKVNGKWTYDANSKYNRRITGETEFAIHGPAAGHALMKTNYDPSGTKVRGMLNNCAGGVTPWGTWLSCEENVNGYFWGPEENTHPNAKLMKRYGIPGGWYNWGVHFERFDVTKEPNESNRFGWVVEIDPTDPTSTPKKRTALGRMKHEACNLAIMEDNTVVAYMGDDERFEYVYKFVAAKKYDPSNRAANMDLLDEGTLYVAKFAADGTVTWLPLVQGQNGLTAEAGFPDQATVLINARGAADILGATKMDRPEDVEVNHQTHRVYVALTNNSRRKAEQKDEANPRAENQWGQIVEIIPADGKNHAAATATWKMLVRAGNPSDQAVGAAFHPATSENGWFSCPDNLATDSRGRLWVTTDQGEAWSKVSGSADGLWAVETEGEMRGYSRMFYRNPVGAELCGPCFAPDDRSLFLAVQHPATDGVDLWKPFGRLSSFEDPATRWPDFQPNMPPRPSILAITKQDGGVIGL
ncbi:PhoX family phosphatase [Azospirillum sp. SYSU D00513]|uniref:PhoX family protein n=1 Tax=Azospirillum sp. SYSU D00513 TaxID=2812561 RepID=UPI001FFF89B4|nr:PhoX family phosphatase [Azospirillum sp. SYSU D00513]